MLIFTGKQHQVGISHLKIGSRWLGGERIVSLQHWSFLISARKIEAPEGETH